MQNLLRRSRILSHAKRGFFTRRSLQSSASIFDSSSRRQRRDRMLQDRQGNMSEEADATSILDKKPIGTEFFITCHPGFESVLAGELHGLGFSPLKMSKAGVSFWSERSADGIRACLWLRSAIRVLMLLSRQHLSTDVDHGIRSGDSVSYTVLKVLIMVASPAASIIKAGLFTLHWSRNMQALCLWYIHTYMKTSDPLFKCVTHIYFLRKLLGL